MELMRKIHKTCLLPVIVLLAMLVLWLPKGAESAYTYYFVEAEVIPDPSGEVTVYAKGGNMLRVNSFYINGERLEDCIVERMTYDKCRIVFDSSVFSKGNTWYEFRVGYHKWGFIDLLSSAVWIEWTGS